MGTGKKSKKVAVAISGGVDSAVAAALLKKKGYVVIGVHMVCWEEDTPGCSAPKDRNDAAKVAATLDIPFLVWNFSKEYKNEVIDYFYREYRQGRTPNPDIMCNQKIKFGLFFDKAFRELSVDYVATGHYARIKTRKPSADLPCGYKLLAGIDSLKDQSYFLYRLSCKHLSKTLFPLGSHTKRQVRTMAKDFGLPVWDKPDSQGICFIGKVDVKEFLRIRIAPQKGRVLDTRGNVIGEHDGAAFYTIGQRHGFKITRKYSPKALYVLDKNIKENTLIVGTRKQAMRDTFKVEDLHWIQEPESPAHLKDASVRIRHLGELYPIKEIEIEDETLTKITLARKAFGIAPGQSAVFYRGDEVLGGGIIR